MIPLLPHEFDFSAAKSKHYGRGKDFLLFHSFSAYIQYIDLDLLEDFIKFHS